MDSLNYSLSPSYEDLEKYFDNVKGIMEIPVSFSNNKHTIKGLAYLGILSKTVDLWFDFNDVEVIVNN